MIASTVVEIEWLIKRRGDPDLGHAQLGEVLATGSRIMLSENKPFPNTMRLEIPTWPKLFLTHRPAT